MNRRSLLAALGAAPWASLTRSFPAQAGTPGPLYKVSFPKSTEHAQARAMSNEIATILRRYDLPWIKAERWSGEEDER
jgi:hypothetical protein